MCPPSDQISAGVDGRSIEIRTKADTKIDAQIDQKMVPGPTRARQIASKSSSIHLVRSKDVPGASRDVSAAPRERPKGVPGEARDAFGEPEKAIRRQSSTILDRNVV